MKKILILILTIVSTLAFANVKAVATTTIIYDLVRNIGQDKVGVDYLCRGNQDPHFLEVMPSYMLKLRSADLVFEIGLDLEKWLPQLIDGSRNTNLQVIDLSKDIEKKEVPTAKMDARYGDVHPYGNPHYYLDPADVKIKIYTVSGRLIQELEKSNVIDKFVRVNWDGRDRDGNIIANGTYLYKIIVKNPGGEFTKSVLGKLAVIR